MLDKKTLRQLKGLPPDSDDELPDDSEDNTLDSDDESEDDEDEASEDDVSKEVVDHLKPAVASSTALLLKIGIHSVIDIASPVLRDLVSLSPTIDIAATAIEPPIQTQAKKGLKADWGF
jgi:hypothetical protein